MNFNTLHSAPKRAVNLTLNSKTVDMAKELGLNVSQTVDALLGEEVKRKYWESWRERNKEAMEAYNARLAKDGLTLAKYRTWGQSLGDGKQD